MAEQFPLPPRRIDIHNHLWNDPGGEKLLEIMDKASIETALIMGTKPSSFHTVGTNEAVIEAMRKHPGRFVAGAYIDPREGARAIDAVRHYKDEGACVVKVFPNYGYFPDDDDLCPFWDAVGESGMAVLSHCGWLGGSAAGMNQERWAAYYSHPGRFEKVVRTHIDTIFIMAHMGGLAGWLDTVMLTTRTPNLYVDCSPGQGRQVLDKGGPFVSLIPPEKLMFGADSYDVVNLVTIYQEIMVRQGFGPHFDKIYYSNARGILEKIGAIKPARKTTAKQAAKRK
ncbi:MAG: amidohydrolase family protein [Phycisphaerae bacterium]